MPLFMDVHETLPAEATARDVAAAHREAHGLLADRIYEAVEGE
jgi:hypothetical protein